ncbi:FAS1-like dehydratase domain-containing protein [Pseudomonas aeruginosa]|uniref:FAS1-like dehydratase domain-containing protein n=1 Tax=Pseudomonas aeruginosa TaxID=287 RepID=UPI002F918DEA
MSMHADAWEAEWQPMITAIGRDFDDRPVVFVADRIERSAVRRWLEPLEFDCALHFDPDVARAYGYTDIVVPNTALSTFALAPMWRPGEVIFTDDARDAQPLNTPLSGLTCELEPETNALFVTDIEIDYLLPVTVGDRLLRRGATLIACMPKETKVGRGAFVTWQSELINDNFNVVARSRTTYFRYNPHPRP